MTINCLRVAGSVAKLHEDVLQGYRVRVYLQEDAQAEHGRLIELDAVSASVDGTEVTGSAYIFHSSVLGHSTWVKIVVTTASDVTEASVTPDFVTQQTTKMVIVWYVQIQNAVCNPVNPLPMNGIFHVVSHEHGHLTAYDVSTVRSNSLGIYGHGLYVSDGKPSVDIRFSLRKLDFYDGTERVAWVDPISKEGDSLMESSSWKESITFGHNCYKLVLDTSDSTKKNSTLALRRSLQSGKRIVVSAECYDKEDFTHYVTMAERVVVTGSTAEPQLVTAHVRGGVTYISSTLAWTDMSVNSEGIVWVDGKNASCSNVMFYAEMINKSRVLTIKGHEDVAAEHEEEIRRNVFNGLLPRLLLQPWSGNLEYFNIESAEIKPDLSVWLRSYRYVTKVTPDYGFHVFTFDVLRCEYSHEVHSLTATLHRPPPEGTAAYLITLFFDKTIDPL